MIRHFRESAVVRLEYDAVRLGLSLGEKDWSGIQAKQFLALSLGSTFCYHKFHGDFQNYKDYHQAYEENNC